MTRNKLAALLIGLAIPFALYAADVKISALPAATTLAGTEALPVVQSGSTVRSTPSAISTYTISTINVNASVALDTGTTGTLAVGRGGSGATTLTGLLQGNGTGAFTVISNSSTVGQTLRVTGTNAYGWGALDLADTDAITGALPSTNGGTGSAFFAVSGPASSLKTFTFPNASASVLTSAALVSVAQGGTGVATLTGLLLGNGTSPFSAAASSNVVSLWSGTCNSGTYLRGDGSCQSPSGSGTVTSVAITMPGIFSVSGSPITASGTLAVTASGTSGGIPYFSGSTTMGSSAALTANGVVIGGGAGNTPTSTSAGTAGQILTSNGSGSAPTFQSGVGVNTLPSSAGLSTGDLFLVYDLSDTQSQQATAAQLTSFVLGNAFTTFTGPTTSTKTFTLPNASATVLTTNAAVTVAQGGTGAATLTGLVLGNGTSAFTTVTAPSGTVVGTSDTQTLTNKRINPRIQSAADATSITPTGDTADQTIQANTQTAGTLTVNAPTGTPVDGQKWVLRLKSTNVQTFSWNAIYRGSTDAALPTASTGGGKIDYYAFIYSTDGTKWDFVSKVAGF